MTEEKLAWINDEVAALKEQGLYITIRTIDSPPTAWMVVDGKRVLNLCTNNYLGLATHPRLVEAAKAALDRFGAGPTAVRTIAGTLSLHVELEKKVAEFKGVEDALYVQSGFNANQAAIP
ncbi:MAG: aminotransferase class I/II-fold pyridoxal phosphate-dependent enzyme, partial [Chloroflexi bacterium]